MRHSTRVPGRRKAILLGLLCAPAVYGTHGAAQDVAPVPVAGDDCGEVVWADLDDPSLTREEKIARLEQILLDSLKKFGECLPGGGGGSGGSAGSGGGGVRGSQGTQGAQGADARAGAPAGTESAPVTGVQGDRPASQSPRQGSGAESQDARDGRVGEDILAGQRGRPRGGAMPPNGKAPEDIPPVENDDIIARQFRQAALEETDPVARAKLWNEYRRYKNLPVQEIPET